MEKKNRKFSLGQRVLFEEKEYEICYIDLTCKDEAKIYGLAELDAKTKKDQGWERNIADGSMITNHKKIRCWSYENDLTPVDEPKETLLEEAKRRYPKGTEYYCAHLTAKHQCIVSNPEKFFISGDCICESYGDTGKNEHFFDECLYANGKWAEIVSTPTDESKPAAKEYKYKEGDEVSSECELGRKFIVRGYSENLKRYIISSKGFDGHKGDGHSLTWGTPVKDKSNWWSAESNLIPWVEEEKDPNVFPAGSYVVLLAGCNGKDTWGKGGLPINHCYKLNSDSNSNSFYPDIDANGSTSNGWSAVNYDSELKLRAATPEEIAKYIRLGKPFDVTTLEEESVQIGRWYQGKNESRLFIKPIRIKSEDFKVDVIWSNGTYGDSYLSKNDFKDWNLLDNLSIIQAFLPDGHPDKVTNSIQEVNEQLKKSNPEGWNKFADGLFKVEQQLMFEKEKTPLEICKEKYKAGMKIMSVVGSRALLTKKDVSELYVNGRGEVYTSDGSYQLYKKKIDKYAEILEETEPKSLVGRYLKALVDNPNFAACYKKGDYIEILKDYGGSVLCTNGMNFGDNEYDWKISGVELMPEGFHPDDVKPTVPLKEIPLEEMYAGELAEVERLFPEGTEGTYKCPYDGRKETCERNGPLELNEHEGIIRLVSSSRGLLWSTKHGYSTPNTTPKLKGGQWVKIIDKPEGGRPLHWNGDGLMDKYFGQWVQVSKKTYANDFTVETDDENDHWNFKHSDYTEVRDDFVNLDVKIGPIGQEGSWLDVQQECHRLQYQYALLMHERESLIRNSVPTYTRPLTPQECHKPCESKEDIVSSHLILLDVKPVRVSKQFK